MLKLGVGAIFALIVAMIGKAFIDIQKIRLKWIRSTPRKRLRFILSVILFLSVCDNGYKELVT